MIDATGLGGVVGDGAAWEPELVVESDAGCEGEQPGGDAGAEVVGGAGSVAFEAEQVFAGDKDGFDSLPDRGEVDAVVGLVLAGWSDDRGAEFGDGVSELAAGVAFVADDGFAAVEAAGQQRQRDLAFGAVGSDECGRLGGAVEGADQMQPHPPEPAGVTLAVAVAAHLGQVGAAG